MSFAHQLLPEAEAHARVFLKQCEEMGYEFHTIRHTEQVVMAVQEISIQENLPPETQSEIVLAAWFHDIGYTEKYVDHESASKRLTEEFLRLHGAETALIERVLALIEATRLGIEPETLEACIIKDADLYNLATDEALEYTAQLRTEWKRFCSKTYDDVTWFALNLDFYKNHKFYTSYGKEKLAQKKAANIKVLTDKLASVEQASNPQKLSKKQLRKQIVKQDKKLKKLGDKLIKAKKQKPDRGIETMFRATYRVHMELSSIADNKANILLSINSIIISILFTSIVRQLDLYPVMLWPAITLTLVCMTTIVFSILATRPKINSGVFTREDIINRETNLLFFGNFFKMPLDDYMWGIREMMYDSDYLYGSMMKDIYFLGVVLAKRFKMLRIAYTIFMYGMAVSVILFAVAMMAQKWNW